MVLGRRCSADHLCDARRRPDPVAVRTRRSGERSPSRCVLQLCEPCLRENWIAAADRLAHSTLRGTHIGLCTSCESNALVFNALGWASGHPPHQLRVRKLSRRCVARDVVHSRAFWNGSRSPPQRPSRAFHSACSVLADRSNLDRSPGGQLIASTRTKCCSQHLYYETPGWSGPSTCQLGVAGRSLGSALFVAGRGSGTQLPDDRPQP